MRIDLAWWQAAEPFAEFCQRSHQANGGRGLMTRTKLTGSCSWNCGRETDNKSHICDFCWKAAELSRTNTDEGYKAWAERKRAKAVPKEPKPRSEAQRAA